MGLRGFRLNLTRSEKVLGTGGLPHPLRLVLYPPLVLFLALMPGPCDEPLPAYKEPDRLFDVRLRGEYFLGMYEHSLRVYVEITNIFDETLVGPASLTGTVQVTAADDPNVRKTLTFTSQNILTARGYNAGSGILKIDPQEKIVLRATWYFAENKVVDDSGRDLAHGNEGRDPFFSYVVDKTCEFRKLARPEDFILQGQIKVFQRTGPAVADPSVFPFCFITNFVDSKTCPTIMTDPPCNYWPEPDGQ
ncbi:MAG: hypothetical protein FJ217_00205 [Ignavibacteria bacterium]|nr:hypothetical protein [Ignavibacteria bacterium]